MSPFAAKLKSIRELRRLRQNELAHKLGYEPSYLSALERGEKGPPRQDFIRRLIRELNLNQTEQEELERAIHFSRRQISLPAYASEGEFEFLHLLEPNLGKLLPQQLQLMRLILLAPETFWSTESMRGMVCPQSVRTEAPKM